MREGQGPQSARGPRDKKKIRYQGSLTARGAAGKHDQHTNYLEVHHDDNAPVAGGSEHVAAGAERGRNMSDASGALLPPAPTDWLFTPRTLPSSRVAAKMISTMEKLGGPVLETKKSPSGKKSELWCMRIFP